MVNYQISILGKSSKSINFDLMTCKNNIDMTEVEKEGIFLLSEENEKFREEILNFKPHELLVKTDYEK